MVNVPSVNIFMHVKGFDLRFSWQNADNNIMNIMIEIYSKSLP